VNVAGCSKRCAMRGAASVQLIATDAGYDVLTAGTLMRTAVSADAALDLAVAVAQRAFREQDRR
jgi:hypothetical protein